MRKAVALTALTLVLLAPAVYYAPTFLLVADAPVKSDAVILFLGGERGTREKEARQLIREGWADYLITPARNQVLKLDPNGKFERILLESSIVVSNQRTNEPMNQRTSSHSSPPNQPTNELTKLRNRVIEDTHSEAIIAKEMMERMGLRSAILVSSPYHMRRIKVIAGKVFGESQSVHYVPTRHETWREGFWLFEGYDRRFVITEYAKIAWFLIYSPFV